MLPLGDDVLEIETLYNRPDLTSIYGIAREVAALTGGELKPMPGTTAAGRRARATSGSTSRSTTSRRARASSRALSRDVTIGESPAWLKARLIGAGMRPISNVVDITNYVMLALGSPLHAYDAETLAGGRIVVRRARPGEELVTLDGTRRELDPADLVIADAERPIGLAGVMGGENTEVSDSTTSVVLETANFEPLTVLRSGERHHMRSESQTRWEKGVDSELAPVAASYATELFAELAGARWTGENEVRADPPPPPRIAYRPAYASEALGLEMPEDEQRERLGRLGFAVEADWTVVTPVVARPRRAARHRRGRGGRALPARGRARDAARSAGDVRPAEPLPAAAPPGRGRARRRRASTRRTPTRCRPRIPTRLRSSCRCRSARSSGCCARR